MDNIYTSSTKGDLSIENMQQNHKINSYLKEIRESLKSLITGLDSDNYSSASWEETLNDTLPIITALRSHPGICTKNMRSFLEYIELPEYIKE